MKKKLAALLLSLSLFTGCAVTNYDVQKFTYQMLKQYMVKNKNKISDDTWDILVQIDGVALTVDELKAIYDAVKYEVEKNEEMVSE